MRGLPGRTQLVAEVVLVVAHRLVQELTLLSPVHLMDCTYFVYVHRCSV